MENLFMKESNSFSNYFHRKE